MTEAATLGAPAARLQESFRGRGHQVRPGEAQGASFGAAKAGTLTVLQRDGRWTLRGAQGCIGCCSLRHMGLQPPSHMVTGAIT